MTHLKTIGLKLLNKKKLIVYTITFIVLTVTLILTSAYNYSNSIQNGIATDIIRLHVIANSDSEHDQEVKRKVRDEVLKYMNSQSVNSKSTDDARSIICSNLERFKEIAEQTLRSNGFNYEAKVYFGKYPFPTKVYGDVTFPAGEYESLRIILGNGSGANWWCVMFPPLCFVDASKGIVPDSSKAQLKNVMTEEEYRLVMSNSTNTDSEVKIKFKIVELFQQSKVKMATH